MAVKDKTIFILLAYIFRFMIIRNEWMTPKDPGTNINLKRNGPIYNKKIETKIKLSRLILLRIEN